MLKDLKAVIQYLTLNVRYPFTIFWSILLAIFLISFLLSTINGSPHLLFQASIPIYIFCLVLGMWTVKNTIPYLLKMSVTRKLIYAAIGIYFLLLAAVQALLANTLIKIVDLTGKTAITGDVSFHNGSEDFSFQFYHLSQFLQNDSFLTQVTIDTIIAFSALSAMFFIGLIFYRFGLVGGFTTISALFFIYIVSIAQGSFIELVNYIFTNYSMTLYFQLLTISIIIYLLSFPILRRLTITSN